MTGVEYECWMEHLLWDAKAKSGDVSPKFVGDPEVYERWRGKVESANALVQAKAFERKKRDEQREMERVFGRRPPKPAEVVKG